MADNVYNLKFTLSNGDVIDAGQITAPQGPKGDKGDSADIPYSSSTPLMDGVGSVGSANTVARGDHRHPSDTSRQEKLVSGTNIKTINGQSVLGSGDITISGGGTSEYANTSETIELTSTYTSLNTLCADILTNKTKVSYVAYSKISGITSLVIPSGRYGATNGYLYFKVVSNGRVVSTGVDTGANVDRFIEVFYSDIYTSDDGRRFTGLLSNGAYGSTSDWYFSGWVDPVSYSASDAININNRTLASKVYIWMDNSNGEFWEIDSSGIVRYYQGQIEDRVLISGTNGNTKTINGETIYGSGDIAVSGSKYYKHYLEIDFVHNTSLESATIYMTDTNYAANTISDLNGFVYRCFPLQEEPSYPVTYHEATGFYGSTPVVAIKYTASKIYAVTTTGEKEIMPSIGMLTISDYVVDLSTNMKPVTT